MAWPDVADLCNRAVRNTFGETVTYTPASGAPAFQLVAPFDAAFAVVEIQAGVPVTSVRPVLDVRLADLPAAPEQGDTYTRASGAVFEVAEVQLGGHGTAKLISLAVS